MKKLIMILMLAIFPFVSSSAQTQYYRSTSFAIKENPYGSWSNWQDSNVLITFNLTNDIIQIYSPTHQKFRVNSSGEKFYDNNGGQQVKFQCTDMVDWINCTIRLRIESNGNSQIYVDYANISYVYNVRRTR